MTYIYILIFFFYIYNLQRISIFNEHLCIVFFYFNRLILDVCGQYIGNWCFCNYFWIDIKKTLSRDSRIGLWNFGGIFVLLFSTLNLLILVLYFTKITKVIVAWTFFW